MSNHFMHIEGPQYIYIYQHSVLAKTIITITIYSCPVIITQVNRLIDCFHKGISMDLGALHPSHWMPLPLSIFKINVDGSAGNQIVAITIVRPLMFIYQRRIKRTPILQFRGGRRNCFYLFIYLFIRSNDFLFRTCVSKRLFKSPCATERGHQLDCEDDYK